MFFYADPGDYVIKSKAENEAVLPISIKQGEVIYVKQIPTPGFIFSRNELKVLDSVEGMYYVKNTKTGKTILTNLSDVSTNTALPVPKSNIFNTIPEENKSKSILIKLNYASVDVLGGSYKENLDNGFNPKADSYTGYSFGADLDINWIFVGVDIYEPVHYNKIKYKPLGLYNLTTIRAGLNGKLNVYKGFNSDEINLYAKIGGNYSMLNLDADFKALFPPDVVFYKGPATGFGYTAGIGADYIMGNFLFGIGMFVDGLYPKFDEASQSLDTIQFRMPLYIGAAF